MKMLLSLHMETRQEWRSWLARHYADASEVWLVWYKKHTGKGGISYEEAVEEALCFGWIDSILQRLDEERYARRFTPRKPNSVWSHLNKQRALKMLQAGAMETPGRLVLPSDVLKGSIAAEPSKGHQGMIPPLIRRGLSSFPKAAKNFNGLPPSTQRLYVRWVMEAKKKDTRTRRLRELVETLVHGRRLGMK